LTDEFSTTATRLPSSWMLPPAPLDPVALTSPATRVAPPLVCTVMLPPLRPSAAVALPAVS